MSKCDVFVAYDWFEGENRGKGNLTIASLGVPRTGEDVANIEKAVMERDGHSNVIVNNWIKLGG